MGLSYLTLSPEEKAIGAQLAPSATTGTWKAWLRKEGRSDPDTLLRQDTRPRFAEYDEMLPEPDEKRPPSRGYYNGEPRNGEIIPEPGHVPSMGALSLVAFYCERVHPPSIRRSVFDAATGKVPWRALDDPDPENVDVPDYDPWVGLAREAGVIEIDSDDDAADIRPRRSPRYSRQPRWHAADALWCHHLGIHPSGQRWPAWLKDWPPAETDAAHAAPRPAIFDNQAWEWACRVMRADPLSYRERKADARRCDGIAYATGWPPEAPLYWAPRPQYPPVDGLPDPIGLYAVDPLWLVFDALSQLWPLTDGGFPKPRSRTNPYLAARKGWDRRARAVEERAAQKEEDDYFGDPSPEVRVLYVGGARGARPESPGVARPPLPLAENAAHETGAPAPRPTVAREAASPRPCRDLRGSRPLPRPRKAGRRPGRRPVTTLAGTVKRSLPR